MFARWFGVRGAACLLSFVALFSSNLPHIILDLSETRAPKSILVVVDIKSLNPVDLVRDFVDKRASLHCSEHKRRFWSMVVALQCSACTSQLWNHVF